MEQKKKIMAFMYSLHDGGAQRTMVNIINNLDKSKYEVVLVLGTQKNNVYIDLINKDIRVEYLSKPKLRKCIFKLAAIIRAENPSLIFTTLNNNNIILSISKLISCKKIPIVVRETNNRTQSKNVSVMNRIMTYFAYNCAAKKIVALSEGVKIDLIDNFKINPEKIVVIYNPVEVDEIKKMAEEKVEEINVSSKEKILIAAGRLAEQKDYPTMLRAFSQVLESQEARLIILGRGPLESNLKELCKELGIIKKVNFLGFKSNPYKYISKADIFLLSSRWEGFGHVIVEAMACGVPVIATDCKSGPAEIIKSNQYGVLVPVGDVEILAEKTIEALKDDILRQSFIDLGYKRAHDFRASEITNQYARLFDECFHKRDK